jgi:hypothetical protein
VSQLPEESEVKQLKLGAPGASPLGTGERLANLDETMFISGSGLNKYKIWVPQVQILG